MFELASRLVGIYKTSNTTKTIAIDNNDVRSRRGRSVLTSAAARDERANVCQRRHRRLGRLSALSSRPLSCTFCPSVQRRRASPCHIAHASDLQLALPSTRRLVGLAPLDEPVEALWVRAGRRVDFAAVHSVDELLDRNLARSAAAGDRSRTSSFLPVVPYGMSGH